MCLSAPASGWDGNTEKNKERAEMSHQELGREVLHRVAETLKDLVAIERDVKLEGKNMTMILAPKPQKSSKPKQQTESKGGNSNAKD